jgi:hypothetical protein
MMQGVRLLFVEALLFAAHRVGRPITGCLLLLWPWSGWLPERLVGKAHPKR